MKYIWEIDDLKDSDGRLEGLIYVTRLKKEKVGDDWKYPDSTWILVPNKFQVVSLADGHSIDFKDESAIITFLNSGNYRLASKEEVKKSVEVFFEHKVERLA